MCCQRRMCSNTQYIKMCERAPKINYSICRGYYIDSPCCPLTYIGNNGGGGNNQEANNN